jgi:hypothetical protein
MPQLHGLSCHVGADLIDPIAPTMRLVLKRDAQNEGKALPRNATPRVRVQAGDAVTG